MAQQSRYSKAEVQFKDLVFGQPTMLSWLVTNYSSTQATICHLLRLVKFSTYKYQFVIL